jgi:hypothetical protein
VVCGGLWRRFLQVVVALRGLFHSYETPAAGGKVSGETRETPGIGSLKKENKTKVRWFMAKSNPGEMESSLMADTRWRVFNKDYSMRIAPFSRDSDLANFIARLSDR